MTSCSSGAGRDALRPETEETTSVVIIGVGPAGIAAAIALKDDLAFDGFTVSVLFLTASNSG